MKRLRDPFWDREEMRVTQDVVELPAAFEGFSGRLTSVEATPRSQSSRRRSERRLALGVFLSDAAALTAAITAAHMVRYDMLIPASADLRFMHPGLTSVSLFLSWMVCLAAFGTRDARILDSGPRQYQTVTRASFALFAWISIAAFVFNLNLSRGFVAMAGIGGVVALFVTRWAWRQSVIRGRGNGSYMSNVLVIGGVRSAKGMAGRFAQNCSYGLRVVGVWVPDRPAASDEVFRTGELTVPVFGTETDFGMALDKGAVDTVVVTDTEHLGHDGMRDLAWALEGRDVDLLVAPNVVDVAGPRVHLQAHGNMPLIHLTGPTYSRTKKLRRAVFDRTFAALVLIASSPVLALAALAVRLTSRGPIFYKSERLGAHGVPFELYKLRTMVADAESRREALLPYSLGDGPLFKMQDDPRVTRVGRFLRRFSIDEIPQFINVLKGDMSVVGPRPHLPGELEAYGALGKRRLLVKQGITGLWQVSGRSDLSWEDSVRLDLDYVENWSMLGDLQIIARTLRAVIRSSGAY